MAVFQGIFWAPKVDQPLAPKVMSLERKLVDTTPIRGLEIIYNHPLFLQRLAKIYGKKPNQPGIFFPCPASPWSFPWSE